MCFWIFSMCSTNTALNCSSVSNLLFSTEVEEEEAEQEEERGRKLIKVQLFNQKNIKC